MAATESKRSIEDGRVVDSASFRVRRVRVSDDIAAVRELLQENECLIAIGKSQQRDELTRCGTAYVQAQLQGEFKNAKTWESQIAESLGGAFWVVENAADGKVVGSVCVSPASAEEEEGGSEFELRRMYVDTTSRKRGLGRSECVGGCGCGCG